MAQEGAQAEILPNFGPNSELAQLQTLQLMDSCSRWVQKCWLCCNLAMSASHLEDKLRKSVEQLELAESSSCIYSVTPSHSSVLVREAIAHLDNKQLELGECLAVGCCLQEHSRTSSREVTVTSSDQRS
mmetsp:Transcript_16582/g.38310  ORF Transcript_16582/g.38310 Transcript_16582/m.38310 type:complete len:129 (+) Transcript_16582:1485-1871(+)